MFMKKFTFKTLEHLFKHFETTLPNLSLDERVRKVHSGISFFYVATVIATAVYSKNMTKNVD